MDRCYLLDLWVNPDLLTNGGIEGDQAFSVRRQNIECGESKVRERALFTAWLFTAWKKKYSGIKIHSLPPPPLPCQYICTSQSPASKPFCISQITLHKITLTNIQWFSKLTTPLQTLSLCLCVHIPFLRPLLNLISLSCAGMASKNATRLTTAELC